MFHDSILKEFVLSSYSRAFYYYLCKRFPNVNFQIFDPPAIYKACTLEAYRLPNGSPVDHMFPESPFEEFAVGSRI